MQCVTQRTDAADWNMPGQIGPEVDVVRQAYSGG